MLFSPELPHWDSILSAEMQPIACMSVRLREGNNQVQNEQSPLCTFTFLKILCVYDVWAHMYVCVCICVRECILWCAWGSEAFLLI